MLHEHRYEAAQMDFVHQVGHAVTRTDRNHETLVGAFVFVFLCSFDRGDDVGGRCVSRLFGGLHDLRYWCVVFVRLFVVNQVPCQVDAIGIFRFHVFIGYQTTRSCLLDAVSGGVRVGFYACCPDQRVCRNHRSVRQLDAVLLDICDPVAFDDLDALLAHVFFCFLLFFFGYDTQNLRCGFNQIKTEFSRIQFVGSSQLVFPFHQVTDKFHTSKTSSADYCSQHCFAFFIVVFI
ncbi:hypothetical protein SDC9_104963 [bioreactor metagenome]|uniref:Uncharacterized protein n=1 Tax=bioreactor metagenome TaxID=1076179 RepID=A0A645B8X8_9ZZZZ